MTGKHLHLLDGLRGYAAIIVVLYHLTGLSQHDLPVNAGLLAVDLFFVMSGLVIEMNYGERLRSGQMSFGSFTLKRLNRLYPVYIFGALLGLTYYFWMHRELSAPEIVATFLSAFLILPQFLFGFEGQTFAYNWPAWSLSLEIYGNLIFALVAIRLSSRTLALTMAAALAVFAFAVWSEQSLDIGPGADDFFLGFGRFWYSFAAGLLIWRWRARFPRIGIAAPIIVVAAMLFPALPADIALRLFWVVVMMPLAVIAAVQIQVGPIAAGLCSHLGKISYPIYIIHFPVLYWSAAVLTKVFGQELWSNPIAVILVLLSLAAATAVTTYLIEPQLRKAFGHLTARPSKRGA